MTLFRRLFDHPLFPIVAAALGFAHGMFGSWFVLTKPVPSFLVLFQGLGLGINVTVIYYELKKLRDRKRLMMFQQTVDDVAAELEKKFMKDEESEDGR